MLWSGKFLVSTPPQRGQYPYSLIKISFSILAASLVLVASNSIVYPNVSFDVSKVHDNLRHKIKFNVLTVNGTESPLDDVILHE